MTSKDSPATKKQRTEAAREKAAAFRAAEAKRHRRRTFIVQGSIILGLIAIVTVVTLVVMSANNAPQTQAGPANMQSDGIVLHNVDGAIKVMKTPAIPAKGKPVASNYPDDGLAHIITYVDFGCPICNSFEMTNDGYIEDLVKSGKATLEVRPIAILNRMFQTSRYSSRSANVAACVAQYQPNDFLSVQGALFVNQPAEQSDGLTNRELISLVHGAGVKNGNVDDCISHESYAAWVKAATNRATAGELPDTNGVTLKGTPTVIVNGDQFTTATQDFSDFPAFVSKYVKG